MEIIIEITGNRYRGEIPEMALPVIKRPDEFQLFGKKFKLIEEPDTKMTIDLKSLFPFLRDDMSQEIINSLLKQFKDLITAHKRTLFEEWQSIWFDKED